MSEARYHYLTRSYLEALGIPLEQIVHFEGNIYSKEDGGLSWKMIGHRVIWDID